MGKPHVKGWMDGRMDGLSALRRKDLYSAPKFTFQWCDLAKGSVLSLRDIQRVSQGSKKQSMRCLPPAFPNHITLKQNKMCH